MNGRQVKSKLLMAALERAYENQKMVGKFPGCALQLQLKANAVDVNVHPAKTEVKFLYERKVFDGVYYTVLAALNGEKRHPDLVFPEQKKTESVQMSAKTPPAASTANPSAGGGFQRMSAQQFREGQTLRDPAAAALLRPLAREKHPQKQAQGEPEFSPVSPQETEKNPQLFLQMWINRWKMLKTSLRPPQPLTFPVHGPWKKTGRRALPS